MKAFWNYLIVLSAGGLVFWGISELIGIVFPSIAKWVFIALSVWWAYVGWVYSGMRTRGEI